MRGGTRNYKVYGLNYIMEPSGFLRKMKHASIIIILYVETKPYMGYVVDLSTACISGDRFQWLLLPGAMEKQGSRVAAVIPKGEDHELSYLPAYTYKPAHICPG